MKAPDKFYMPNELLSEEWCRHIEGQDTEYIRKDALMEWLMDEMDRSEKFSTCEHYSNVIDHLEEM